MMTCEQIIPEMQVRQIVLFIIVFALLLLPAFASATVFYVDKDATGADNGSSWADAFTTIQPGVDAAFAAGGGEVWVAEGTYTLSDLTPVSTPVVIMKNTVNLYGGFVGQGVGGNELARDQRNWTTHISRIDGSTKRRCVLGADNAVLDGFTCSHGFTTGLGEDSYGGGMYNNYVSPTVINCTFESNQAGGLIEGAGGAIANTNSNTMVHNCRFSNNSAGYAGGAMNNFNGAPTIKSCVFSYNYVGNVFPSGGGAINNPGSSPQILNCVFWCNTAHDEGGGIHNFAAVDVEIGNCTFFGNTAGVNGGGAIFSLNGSSGTVTNCVFWGNINGEIMGEALQVTYSDIQGGYSGTGNIDQDPLFINAVGGDLRLQPTSPCIDTGTAAGAPNTDLIGIPRPIDISGKGIDGPGLAFDLGAYEYTESGWILAKDPTPWSVREQESVTFDGRLWVLGGREGGAGTTWYNDVWSSADGINWTQATNNASWTGRQCHACVAFDNRMWVLGGFQYGTSNVFSDVWSTSDGVTWSQDVVSAPWGSRANPTVLSFNGKMWLMGGSTDGWSTGLKNDVWNSVDGITWQQVTPNAGWSPRSENSALVYDNKMWILGGWAPSAGGTIQDVWYSTDGINWTEAIHSAPWPARSWQASVVYDNKMWIIAGYTSGPLLQDAWTSIDGVSWNLEQAADLWEPRYEHTCEVLNNCIYLIGGSAGSGSLSDVHFYTSGVERPGFVYEYDNVQRLTGVAPDNGIIISYQYDPAGNRLEKRVDGPLNLSAGPANPVSRGIANNALDLPILQVRMTSGDAETVVLSSLVFSGTGTASEFADIASVKLWLDTDSNGIADGTDVLLATNTYSADDGTVTFSNLNHPILSGQSLEFLLTYSLNGQANQGETFATSITDRARVVARGIESYNTIYTTGTPIQSANLTVSTDTVEPVFAGLTSAYGIDGAVILDWEAATDSTTPIEYGIWIATTSFSGVITGSPVFLTDGANPEPPSGEGEGEGESSNKAYIAKGLTNGTEYFFVVRARDGAGNWSSTTTELSAVPIAPLLTLQMSADYGTVELTPGGAVYPVGTVVTANPQPDDGYVFYGWTGEILAGQEFVSPLAITMDTNKTVQTTFVRAKGTVEIRITPDGLPAPWLLVDGDAAMHSDIGAKPISDVPTGALSLTWEDVSGYITPSNPEPQYLGNGGTLVFVGNYEMPPTTVLAANPIQGYAPQTVHFADQSSPGTRAILSWAWSFGDGQSSIEQNPWHEYATVGDYQVSLTVTTQAGYSSDTDTIQIKEHLQITEQPQDDHGISGNSHSFTVTATGGYEPLHYQWMKNGENIIGSPDDATFTIVELSMADAGDYTVEIYDSYADSAVSEPANLTVEDGLPTMGLAGMAAMALTLIALSLLVLLSFAGKRQ